MLHFVVALKPEARPLIEHYGLRPEPKAKAFEIFRRDDVALVVSGLGKVAAAAATATLHLTTGGLRHAAWLNVGIAGHGERRVGELILADRILDRASGACWQPPPVLETECVTDQVVTVDRVERMFCDDGAHEMEASGFYATALRFTVAELVHCIKIISDGPSAAPERLSARHIELLIGEQLDPLVRLAQEVLRLSQEVERLAQDPRALRLFLEDLRGYRHHRQGERAWS